MSITVANCLCNVLQNDPIQLGTRLTKNQHRIKVKIGGGVLNDGKILKRR